MKTGKPETRALSTATRPPMYYRSNETLHRASIIFYEKFFRFEIYTPTFES